jgi:molecular chaperone GrpE (heat shock protein)
VVGSRAAPSDVFADQIADTVRPGYAWRGSLLRPQQVIAYVPAAADS